MLLNIIVYSPLRWMTVEIANWTFWNKISVASSSSDSMARKPSAIWKLRQILKYCIPILKLVKLTWATKPWRANNNEAWWQWTFYPYLLLGKNVVIRSHFIVYSWWNGTSIACCPCTSASVLKHSNYKYPVFEEFHVFCNVQNIWNPLKTWKLSCLFIRCNRTCKKYMYIHC